MKRVLLVLALIFTFVLSVPVVFGAQESVALTASAETVNVTALQSLMKSIPAKSTWADKYIDTSTLAVWYNQAENVLDNPSGFTQEYIDAVTMSLSDAYAKLEKHTTEISINTPNVTITVGNSMQLKTQVNPVDGKDIITWKSSDPSIVSVNSNGKITAEKYNGKTVTITATANGHKDTCKVTVTNPLATLTLDNYTKTIYATKSFKIKPSVKAKDGTTNLSDPVVYSWESSNRFCAVVDENGNVTGVDKGGAVITCTAKCGSVTLRKECNVEVLDVINVGSLAPEFTTVGGAITVVEGETETLKVKILPETATIPTLNWKSSDTSVVKILSSGTASHVSTAKIQAVKKGSATLTYSSTDGSGKKGTVTVKVLPKIKTLSLSTSMKVMPEGVAYVIGTTIEPSNAGNQVLKWETTDSNVCSVDKTGRVTAKSRGTCIISCSTTDGSNITKTCAIRVAPFAKNLVLNKTSVKIETGKQTTITPTITTLEGTTYKDFVKWTTSDKTKATVSNGIVTAKAPGTVTITATTTDGTKLSESCTITIIRPVTGVTVTASKSLTYKESFTLKPTVKPSDASNKKVTYSSSDESIATVNASGVVTAKSKAGTAKITCKTVDGGFKAVCKVTVSVSTTGIKLNASTKVLKAGGTYTLKATVSPSNATNKTVKWSTSNSKVATVDSNGVVKAIAGGACTITAKASGGQTAKCTINVTQGVDKLSFTKATYNLYQGQKYTIEPVVAPKTSTFTDFKWTSSNTSVATVNSDGVITAKAVGTSKITCKGDGKTATCTITVTKKVPCKGVELNRYEISLAAGKTYTLKPTFSPSNTSNKNVTWSSSNKSVATVSSKGVVTAVKTGYAEVTCKTADGGYKAVCIVRVNVPVTGIRIINESQTCTIGETKTIICNIYPTNASNRTLVWKSSKTDVATVNSKGVVTGKKTGTTTITASTPDGKYTASCTVKVCVEVTGVKIGKTNITMTKGDSVAMNAVVVPSNASNKKLSWKTNNSNVVSVDNGIITALRTGTAVVTVTTKEGGYSASCYITVIQPVERVVIQYTSLSLNVGVSKEVSQYVQPSYATNKNVKWSSSNTAIATVSQTGKITAKKAGSCDIICKSADGYAQSKLKLTVLQPVKGISFASKTANVARGATYVLTPVFSPKNASNKNLIWATNNSTIATVDNNGIVTGLKTGACTITAKTESGQFTASIKVIVYEPIKSMSFNKTNVTIAVGKQTTITPSFKPDNATYKDVIWSSNNKDVATVDENGIVTARAPGYVVITGKTKYGGIKATCKINVIQPVKSVKINKTTLELDIDETVTLKATVSPKNATNTAVTWSSSDPTVVKVDKLTGKLTALKKGSATITVKTVDGGHTATCKVKVLNKVHEVIMSSKKLTLYIDSTAKLTATVSPSNATNKELVWYSSDQSICLVSSTGKVTPVKVGTATIYAKSVQGGIIGKCVVTVERKASKITLSAPSKTMNVGETMTIIPTVSPVSTTNKTVTWTSDNKSVATVNSKGVVTAKSAGQVVITATVCGDISKTFIINVK